MGRDNLPAPRERLKRSAPSRTAALVESLHLPPIGFVLAMTAGCVVLASGGRPPFFALGVFLTAQLLSQLSISMHNDYCDRELDAKTKPWRAIPRGIVPARLVLQAALTCAGAALIIATWLNVTVGLFIGLGTAAAWLYNARLKATIWAWVPFWIALPTVPLAAFALVGRLKPELWRAYVIAAPLVVSVYLADSFADIPADYAAGVRGLAQRLGNRWSLATCWSCVLLAEVLVVTLGGGTLAMAAPVMGASLASLAVAILVSRAGHVRVHWFAVLLAGLLLAFEWTRGSG